ncbi:MAG TPA: glycine cleavage system aminomethyltransferase GcvT [Cellulomonas sp.]
MTDPQTPETSADVLRSPLHDEHEALGASMVPFAGWLMPLRYAGDLAEHRAVREAAGLFDLSHMGELHLDGPQAGAALDAALVGDLTALAVGRARYTMIVAEDGGVLDDLIVYRLAEESYLVVANAANVRVVADALAERVAPFDATLTDRSLSTALIAVQGPRAAQIVGDLTDPAHVDDLLALKYYAWVPATVGGVPALVARTGYTGEDGFELFVPADAAPGLWRTLLAAGEPLGLVPAGLSARDSLRLEAGMPLYGNELDRTTAPHDAGLGRVVRLDKVDAEGRPLPFVGRAALQARAHATPSRVLVGLVGHGRRAARHGYPVLAGTAPDAASVGTVTSGAPSPTLGTPIAMAYVTPEVSAAGTELAVDVRGRREPVRVVALPFYRRA